MVCLLPKFEDKLARWKEHLQGVLDRTPPIDPPNLEVTPTLNIDVGDITETEVIKPIEHLKRVGGGTDNIPLEDLKFMDTTQYPIY